MALFDSHYSSILYHFRVI